MAHIPIEKLSPMLRQYMELKAERPEVILLIRVGDFFEAYGVDATLIAAALDITLTGRDVNGMDERLPMAGVPYHALDRYLARLVQQGHKVAICDQIEDPKQAKGLVRRAITRVVTPGTLVEDALLDARSNNFLVAAILRTPIAGIGVVDVSTGEFLVCELPAGATEAAIAAEVARIAPAECLVPEDQDALADAIAARCPLSSGAPPLAAACCPLARRPRDMGCASPAFRRRRSLRAAEPPVSSLLGRRF
jgi:DNA mismatch repair protein MutS